MILCVFQSLNSLALSYVLELLYLHCTPFPCRSDQLINSNISQIVECIAILH